MRVHFGLFSAREDPGNRNKKHWRRLVLTHGNLFPHALDALAEGQILSEYIGADYLDLYRLTKQFEHDNYYDQFSPLEFDWYLNLG